ncbi:MAG: hypothetical protein RLY92_1554, partial [Chloroflexota bacterium]
MAKFSLGFAVQKNNGKQSMECSRACNGSTI